MRYIKNLKWKLVLLGSFILVQNTTLYGALLQNLKRKAHIMSKKAKNKYYENWASPKKVLEVLRGEDNGKKESMKKLLEESISLKKKVMGYVFGSENLKNDTTQIKFNNITTHIGDSTVINISDQFVKDFIILLEADIIEYYEIMDLTPREMMYMLQGNKDTNKVVSHICKKISRKKLEFLKWVFNKKVKNGGAGIDCFQEKVTEEGKIEGQRIDLNDLEQLKLLKDNKIVEDDEVIFSKGDMLNLSLKIEILKKLVNVFPTKKNKYIQTSFQGKMTPENKIDGKKIRLDEIDFVIYLIKNEVIQPDDIKLASIESIYKLKKISGFAPLKEQFLKDVFGDQKLKDRGRKIDGDKIDSNDLGTVIHLIKNEVIQPDDIQFTRAGMRKQVLNNNVKDVIKGIFGFNPTKKRFFIDVFGEEKLRSGYSKKENINVKKISLEKINLENLSDIFLLEDKGIFNPSKDIFMRDIALDKKSKKILRRRLLDCKKDLEIEVCKRILRIPLLRENGRIMYDMKDFYLEEEFGDKSIRLGEILPNMVEWNETKRKVAEKLVGIDEITLDQVKMTAERMFELGKLSAIPFIDNIGSYNRQVLISDVFSVKEGVNGEITGVEWVNFLNDEAKIEKIAILLEQGVIKDENIILKIPDNVLKAIFDHKKTDKGEILRQVFGENTVRGGKDGKLTLQKCEITRKQGVQDHLEKFKRSNILEEKDIVSLNLDNLKSLLLSKEDERVNEFVDIYKLLPVTRENFLKGIFGEQNIDKGRLIPNNVQWNQQRQAVAEKLAKYNLIDESEIALTEQDVLRELDQGRASYIPFINKEEGKKPSANRKTLLKAVLGTDRETEKGKIYISEVIWEEITSVASKYKEERYKKLKPLLTRRTWVYDQEKLYNLLMNEGERGQERFKEMLKKFDGLKKDLFKTEKFFGKDSLVVRNLDPDKVQWTENRRKIAERLFSIGIIVDKNEVILSDDTLDKLLNNNQFSFIPFVKKGGSVQENRDKLLKKVFTNDAVNNGQINVSKVSWERVDQKKVNVLLQKGIIETKDVRMGVAKMCELIKQGHSAKIPCMKCVDLMQPNATNRRRLLSGLFGKGNVTNEGKILVKQVNWIALSQSPKKERLSLLLQEGIIKTNEVDDANNDISFNLETVWELFNDETKVDQLKKIFEFFPDKKIEFLKNIFGEGAVIGNEIKTDNVVWNSYRKIKAEQLVSKTIIDENDVTLKKRKMLELLNKDKGTYIPFINKKNSINRNKLLKYYYGPNSINNHGVIKVDSISFNNPKTQIGHRLLIKNKIIIEDMADLDIHKFLKKTFKNKDLLKEDKKRIVKKVSEMFPVKKVNHLKKVYGDPVVTDDGKIDADSIEWTAKNIGISKFLIEKRYIKVRQITPSKNKIIELLQSRRENIVKNTKKMLKELKGVKNHFLKEIYGDDVVENGKIVNKDGIKWKKTALDHTPLLIQKEIITSDQVKPSPARILEFLNQGKIAEVKQIFSIFPNTEKGLLKNIFKSAVEGLKIKKDEIKWTAKVLNKTKLLIANEIITSDQVEPSPVTILDLLEEEKKWEAKKLLGDFPGTKKQLLEHVFEKENISADQKIKGETVQWIIPKTLEHTQLLIKKEIIKPEDIIFNKDGALNLLKQKKTAEALKKVFQLYPDKKTIFLKDVFQSVEISDSNEIISPEKIQWEYEKPKEVALLLLTKIIDEDAILSSLKNTDKLTESTARAEKVKLLLEELPTLKKKLLKEKFGNNSVVEINGMPIKTIKVKVTNVKWTPERQKIAEKLIKSNIISESDAELQPDEITALLTSIQKKNKDSEEVKQFKNIPFIMKDGSLNNNKLRKEVFKTHNKLGIKWEDVNIQAAEDLCYIGVIPRTDLELDAKYMFILVENNKKQHIPFIKDSTFQNKHNLLKYVFGVVPEVVNKNKKTELKIRGDKVKWVDISMDKVKILLEKEIIKKEDLKLENKNTIPLLIRQKKLRATALVKTFSLQKKLLKQTFGNENAEQINANKPEWDELSPESILFQLENRIIDADKLQLSPEKILSIIKSQQKHRSVIKEILKKSKGKKKGFLTYITKLNIEAIKNISLALDTGVISKKDLLQTEEQMKRLFKANKTSVINYLCEQLGENKNRILNAVFPGLNKSPDKIQWEKVTEEDINKLERIDALLADNEKLPKDLLKLTKKSMISLLKSYPRKTRKILEKFTSNKKPLLEGILGRHKTARDGKIDPKSVSWGIVETEELNLLLDNKIITEKEALLSKKQIVSLLKSNKLGKIPYAFKPKSRNRRTLLEHVFKKSHTVNGKIEPSSIDWNKVDQEAVELLLKNGIISSDSPLLSGKPKQEDDSDDDDSGKKEKEDGSSKWFYVGGCVLVSIPLLLLSRKYILRRHSLKNSIENKKNNKTVKKEKKEPVEDTKAKP